MASPVGVNTVQGYAVTNVLRQTPWIVSREALLEDAIEDFLGEVTRQHPWHQDTFEALFESLGQQLEQTVGREALLFTDYSHNQAQAWKNSLDHPESDLATEMLTEFEEYLERFGWNAQYASK
jgi:hypothetical protein